MARKKKAGKGARRGQGEGSITYREDRQLWQGRVELERDPKTGRRRRKYVYGKTKAKVIEKMQRARAAPDAIKSAEVRTVGALFDLYIASCEATEKRASTLQHYRWALGKLRPIVGPLPLAQFNRRRILSAIAAVDGSDYTKRRARSVLRWCLSWAVDEEILARNELVTRKGQKRRERAAKRVRYWSAEEARAFLRAAEGSKFELLFRLLLGTGMRSGEALALRWGDFDFKRGTVRIERGLSEVAGRFHLEAPKTDAGYRTILLSPADAAFVKARRPKGFDRDAYVFVGERSGTFLQRATVRGEFVRVVAAAQVPVRTMHEMRHTHATLLLTAGVPVKAVSERLGHADVTITLQTYGHVMPESRDEAARTIGSLLGGE